MRLTTMNDIFRKINIMEEGLRTLRAETNGNDIEKCDKLSSLEFSFAEFVAQFKGFIVMSEIEYTK